MSFDFKHKDYTIFSYPTLATFEKFLQRSVKDSTLTNKEKANARTELKKVQAAMKNK